MTMHAIALSLGALALSSVAGAARLDTRWKYPDCEADNCYRAFVNKDHIGMAPEFCWDFLTTPHSDASGVPQEFKNCDSDVKLISSACSCITYTYSHSSSVPAAATTSSSAMTVVLTTSSTPAATTTPASSSAAVPSPSSSVVPVTSSTAIMPTGSTTSSGPGASASATEASSATSEFMTTSTVTEVHSYTVTSCSSTVVDCPATTKPYVTVETNVYVTTCPVSSAGPKTSLYPVSSYPVGTSTSTLYATSLYTVTKCPPTVANCVSLPSNPLFLYEPYTVQVRVGRR